MKICLLTSFEKTSGNCDNRITFLNAKLFSQKGHDVSIVFARKMKVPEAFDDAGIKFLFPLINPVLRGGFSLLELFTKLFFLLFRDFDVIYVIDRGLRPANLIPLAVARLFKKVVIVEEWWEWYAMDGWGKDRIGIYGKLLGFYDDKMELPSKKCFHGIICISSGLQERLKRSTNSIVIYGGAEKNNFIAYDKLEARKKLGLSESSLIFGMSNLAVDDDEDNYPFLQAFSQIENKNVKLIVTGAKESLEKLTYINPENLIILGWIPFEDYNRYLSSCDYFVLPFPDTIRNIGRWPNKFGDYMSVKRPVISNDTGDIGTVLKQYKLGILTENKKDAYLELLNNLKCFNNIHGYEFDKILGELSFENRNQKVENYFKGLLTSRHGSSSLQYAG